MFTAAELATARRGALAEAARRPAKGEIAGDGRLAMRVPLRAYLNAVSPRENGGHGASPADEGYWRDMGRLYPESVVRYTSGRVAVVIGERPAGRGMGRLTRFGRVTWHS